MSLNEVKTPSNDTKPSFSGAAGETEPVTVRVYKGSTAQGTPVASVVAPVTARAWSSEAVTSTLVEGEYTAVAGEPSSIGNAEGTSKEVRFQVITKPPTVTLSPVPALSNDTKPSFSGTASESEAVTVRVYKGSRAEGAIVESVVAQVTSGNWESATLGEKLANGEYTAVAGEPSGLGNAEGVSKPQVFRVNTEPPIVTLSSVESPSNHTEPSFSGTASESESVTVKVYKGASPEGAVLESVVAQVTAGSWTSAALGEKLAEGEYTARASEPSAIGNAQGESAPVRFTVVTKPPTVTLTGPPALSNDTTPSFSGTASESEPVTVRVYAGSNAEGTVLESVEAHVSAGKWASAALGQALPEGDYSATAGEPSGLGNAEGKSSAVKFVVHTKPPVVAISRAPATLSNDTEPSFGGTASEALPVRAHLRRSER